MLDKKTLEELQESLQNSFQNIITILKALGTPNRLKILIILLEGPKTFQELADNLQLGSTALANHLTSLRKATLIDKIHHGFYRITQKGVEFLHSIDQAFEKAESLESKEREILERKQLLDSFIDRRK